MELIKAEQLEVMYASNFKKKEAEATGVNLVNQIFKDGNVDELKVFANITRLKDVVTSADKAFRAKLSISEKQSVMGVSFEPKNGAKKYKYTDDPIYNELAEKVKEREALLKLATDSKDVIFDSEGMEVPKVSIEYNSSSITVKY